MTPSELRIAIDEATNSFLASLQRASLPSLADQVIESSILNLQKLINGHAIAIWLPETRDGEEVLTIALNVGERGHEIEGEISQTLEHGLVSKSFLEKETICHQGFFKHREQSVRVDQELGQVTAHQIATPFSLFGQTVGACTVIQTLASGLEQQSDWGFDENDVTLFRNGMESIERLFELNIIRKIG